MWNEELSASLHQSTDVVMFHRLEHSRLQQLARVIADRISAPVKMNEKVPEIKASRLG